MPSSQRRRSRSRGSVASESSHGHGSKASMPDIAADLDELAFCNNFWGYGDPGYEVITARNKGSTKALDDLRAMFRERAAIEDDYARRLAKLAKQSLAKDEFGSLRNSLDTVRVETDATSRAHMELASQIRRDLEGAVNEFVAKTGSKRKADQVTIEKLFRNKQMQEQYVNKAKEKYEQDCIKINSYTAQTNLVQGKDLDKVSAKLDKAQATVTSNERDYQMFVRALKETTNRWNLEWKAFLDQCQDFEEERVEFMRSILFNYANILSAVCVKDDESCERIRVVIEQGDTERDIVLFIHQNGTGAKIPDPPRFVDLANGQSVPSKPTHTIANFQRSTTRQPPPPPPDLPSYDGPPPPERPKSTGSTFQRADPDLTSRSQPQGTGEDRATGDAPGPIATSRPPPGGGPPPGMPGAQGLPGMLRSASPSSAPPVHPPPGGAAVPGPPPSTSSAHFTAPSVHPPSGAVGLPGMARSPSPAPPPPNDDPIAKALSVLKSQNGSIRSTASRNSVLTTLASAGSAASTIASRGQPLEGYQRAPSPSVSAPPQQFSAPPSSFSVPSPLSSAPPRSTSPQPSAVMMRPPPRSTSPVPVEEVVINYQQSLPGERKSPSLSRQNSMASTFRGQPEYPPAQGIPQQERGRPVSGFAGVGARGRSPSPQPFQTSTLQSPAQVQPPQRATSPLGIQLDATGSVTHDQMAEEYMRRQQSQQAQQQGQVHPQVHAPQPQQPMAQTTPSQQRHPSYSQQPTSPMYWHSQQLSHASVYSQPPQPQPMPSYQQPPQPLPSYQQPPQPIPSYQQPPQPTPSYQQPPQPTPSYQQPPQRSPSYQQPPQPSPSYQQPSQPMASYQQSSQAMPSYQQQPPQQPQQTRPQPQQQPSPSHRLSSASNPLHVLSQSSQGVTLLQSPYAQQPTLGSLHSQQPPSQPNPNSPSSYQGRPSTISQAPSLAHPAQQSQPQQPSASPTGQFSEEGKPIIFYVKALFDYEATIDEEFSFQAGDIIAVTATEPDGWWKGELLDEKRRWPGRNTFPSNFVVLLV